MSEQNQPEEEFLAELASALLGQQVGRAHLPLYGVSQEGWVYGSPGQGFLHVNPDAVAAARADIARRREPGPGGES